IPTVLAGCFPPHATCHRDCHHLPQPLDVERILDPFADFRASQGNDRHDGRVPGNGTSLFHRLWANVRNDVSLGAPHADYLFRAPKGIYSRTDSRVTQGINPFVAGKGKFSGSRFKRRGLNTTFSPAPRSNGATLTGGKGSLSGEGISLSAGGSVTRPYIKPTFRRGRS